MKKIIKIICWTILIISILWFFSYILFYISTALSDEYGCSQYYVKYPWMQYFSGNQAAIEINKYFFSNDCKL